MTLTLIEASRTMWCPGLSQLGGHPKGTIHDWLATSTYAPVATHNKIILTGIDKQRFIEVLGSDINRMACAGGETLRNITEIVGLPKSLGWPYVKLYYASLFYA